MKDWKSIPYPAHLHRPAHERANRAAMVTAIALAAGCTAVALGFDKGRDEGIKAAHAQAAAASPLLLTSTPPDACPRSDDAVDILEHTWVHRGTVILRECIRINRPSSLAASNPVQTSALLK